MQLGKTYPGWAASLAKVEIERRRDEAQAVLTRRATVWSAVTGIGGVVLGTLLGAWLAEPVVVVDAPPAAQEQSK